jgi:thiol-disulfide isomerase/thioredoxin
MPSWMGIRYEPVSARRKPDPSLPRGAVQVMTVFPDSPAAGAGVHVGDVVLGADGRRFDELHAIREWTMQSELGRPAQLDVRRGRDPLELTLVPGPFPIEMPELPGPPKVGSTAPPLDLELHRGEKLAGAHPRLLFFWATWCGPCKLSLPELLAFGEQQDVEILAITDEEPEQIDRFLQDFRGGFPEKIASDPLRAAFQEYGVSATPTFVLVGADGVVQAYQRGYTAEQGLQMEGWKYLRPAPTR